ncbi:hypothetical protein BBO99_00006718 [Phytophthora kernoviae]|uniref:carbonic anhydrase n=1 Tax=Phytophthora kernoviae TaxID=325452 RepID=A0A3R7JDQ6_9STRA|nr:hypothetical protein JM16_006460 [Phytophthora kernoviae]RLN38282.1 hypothetical protein BBI17_006734 [Phytophthora kernoviae]RLN77477.1 hypothetical protein BBO99_00006718 [Phytophthora kernoviae]
MKFLTSVSAIAAACALTASTTVAEVATGPVWGYRANDPSMVSTADWAGTFPACGGTRQSPIDIETTSAGGHTKQTGKSKTALSFSGTCSQYNMTEPHEPLDVVVVESSSTCKAAANGVSYNMKQFHLHAPSEHTLDGEPLDGEIHFVHESDDGKALLVVGVFLQKAARSDGWLTPVLNGLDHVNSTDTHESIIVKLRSYATLVRKVIKAGAIFNYPGSLTTPGCDEIADWWVVQTPIKISSADFDRLHKDLVEYHITDDGNNARPVQPLNGRTVTRCD